MWRENLSMIPEHLRPGMENWILHGYLPGSFLKSVLENDLFAAFENADAVSSARIRDVVMFLYNYAPGGCYGNPRKVRAWHESKFVMC